MVCRPTSASSAGDHQEPELAATDLGRAPPVTLLEGLEITYHPSARFKTLRFVEEALR